MSTPVRERRWATTKFETRAADDGTAGGGMFVGHAAVFGARSDFVGWGFVEQVHPLFFDDALGTSDARALFNHDPNMLLGRMSAGTLRCSTDELGLAYEVDPPDTTAGRDLRVSMKRGDVRESSFSWSTAEEAWGETSDGIPLRTLVRCGTLYDVSPVTFPAYPTADSTLRSALSHLAEQRSVPLDDAVRHALDGDLRSLLPTSKAPVVIDLADSRRSHELRAREAARKLERMARS